MCPHCAGGGVARIALGEKTAEAMKSDSWRSAEWPPWLSALLFVLAFPVTVPSLVLHWAFARRWGRVPYVSVFVDGFVVVLACLGSPVLLTLALVAFASALVLLFRFAARQRANTGIFLGYSNLTVLPLVFGAIATTIGFFAGVPSTFYRHGSSSATIVTFQEVEQSKVIVPRHVRIEGAAIDWERRFTQKDGRPLLVTASNAAATFAPLLASGTKSDTATATATSTLSDRNAARSADATAQRRETSANVFVVTTEDGASPTEPLDGMLVAAPSEMAIALAGEPTPTGKLRQVFLVTPDPALHKSLGLDQFDEPISWGFVALGAIGVLLLAFATWRSVDEAR